ncbi:MAG TPA: serine/threonine-protein kinase [Kofleriaceae bacterium]|nr:serine/threonine-protein kinase [Kofleriaceae bacterium]
MPGTTPSLVPGDVLADRFVIEAPAGEGGLGVVFRGWDLEHEAPVAIKILTELTATDVLRFRREAAVLATLRLPGVVRYIAHGETPSGAPYLAMEWLAGHTVAARMEHTGFDIADAVALVRAACAPLAALHARGLIHRDLKPDNLVLTGAAATSVVVIDLGLAKTTMRPEPRVTATGMAMGTPGYMAPEQIRGEPGLDARVDVFALGCVLYELATGFPAFAGENALAVRTKILMTSPPRLTALCPEAPVALERVVSAMIAKDRALRPASAAEVADLLAAVGDLPPGPRRTWNPARPSTERPTSASHLAGPRTLSATATATITATWTGIVLVKLAQPADATGAHDATTEPLAAVGNELRARVRSDGAQLEAVDDDILVVHVPGAASLAELAPRLADTACGMRACVPGARIVVGSGRGAVDELIDAAALVLEHATRAQLFDPGGGASGFVLVDRATARALIAAGFDLEQGPHGYRLVCA